MSDHIYKRIEIIGSSSDSIEQAVNNAVAHAGESLRNIRWLEVNEIRGHVVDNKVEHWQVGVKLGFTLESKDSPETLEEKKHKEYPEKSASPKNPDIRL